MDNCYRKGAKLAEWRDALQPMISKGLYALGGGQVNDIMSVVGH